jgi:tetrapyrrole methylase family protein/MazG family protein
MTSDTYDKIINASKRIFRTGRHPAAQELEAQGLRFETCDDCYQTGSDFESVYEAVVSRVLQAARGLREAETLVYAVPGHPRMAERTVAMLLERAAEEPVQTEEPVQIEISAAMSFLDPAITLLNLDPMDGGLAILDALDPPDPPPVRLGCLYAQVYDRWTASELKLRLLEHYPDQHPVVLIQSAGIPGQQASANLPLYRLDRQEDRFDHLTAVYVPPYIAPGQISQPACAYPLDPLTQVMERLLAPDGCPWDREQNFQTMKEPLINEAYEVIEALDLEDMDKLAEELGDLLLQIVFNTALAMKRSAFDYNDVVAGITQKMIRRHPHVFGEETAQTSQEVLTRWDAIKSQEKGHEKKGLVMEDLNHSLPALLLAYEIQRKARKVGFDWSDVREPLAKLEEDMDGLKRAIASDAGVYEEWGDVLFTLVGLSRFLGFSPEAALINASQKFLRRFNEIETSLHKKRINWNNVGLSELKQMWKEVKQLKNH